METENYIPPITNYGFDPDSIVIEPDQWVLGGAGTLPKVVREPDLQWDASLPDYEPQFGAGWDTFGCTIWGTENCEETLEYRETGIKKNYAERPVYIGTKTRPPGNNPHVIAEWIRNNGLVDDLEMPMTTTFEEFITPDPLPTAIINKGKSWLSQYEFGHEWVFTGDVDRAEKKRRMMEALQWSPLGASVTAWNLENGVYVDLGMRNNHWCMIYGFTSFGWKVFDSYDHSKKIYSFDSEISFCKRYHFSKRTTPIPVARCGWLKRILNLCPEHE